RDAWFGSAPAFSSRRAAWRWPKKAARPSAVKPSAEYCSTSWRSTARSSTIRASAPSAQASKKSGGGMAGIDGPEHGAGALGRPRVGESGVGGEQRADPLCVALANAIEDHSSV